MGMHNTTMTCEGDYEEVPGMATSLNTEPQQAAASPDSSEPSSSGTTKRDMNEIS